jgi:serine/threonine-protein kinase PknK
MSGRQAASTYLMDTLLIGGSVPMRRLRALIGRVAPSHLPVLIQGETGVGKELVARALHAVSGRDGSLVPLNVCALADTMFEASLFGHVRGAFTGALHDVPGYLAEAHCGTLFLDEISGLSLVNQLKLLRAIETKQFRPLGSHRDRQSDFRPVAASNEDMGGLVDSGRFRRDLTHRLAAIRIVVPPLRERMEDVPELVGHFARAVAPKGSDTPITAAALGLLQRHHWPGNVRELRHVVEASMALSGEGVDPDAVASLLERTQTPSVAHGRRRDHDRELIALLDRSAWDVNMVAHEMGVHRATIYRRLKRMGMEDGPRLSRADCAANQTLPLLA